ncbi:SixA phosphatase family protein [Estrella lausannensis]|uniref:SixA phosphatase family protein n=1 Tax=Estrella lausannensis TaxID=483423 RepID=UPI00117ACF51|nr:phosphoglycerate mutase family protein [Estrella lausannensis]
MSSAESQAITLILMRHAEPLPGSALDDMSIPLSPVGKEREKKLCREMERQGLIPEMIIASPCLRTKETAGKKRNSRDCRFFFSD